MFKYENMWKREPSYVSLVKDTWGEPSAIHDMHKLHCSLGRMRSSFLEWDQSVFGSVKQEIAKLCRELENERRYSLFSGPSRRERHIMVLMSELLAREEIMAKQHA
jgi:hypothetical protein